MTTERPTCSYTEAMDQASSTADTYLRKAIKMIDQQFGEGYAKKNPGLIAPLVQAQVDDFNNTCLTGSIWEIAEKISNLSSAIYFGETKVQKVSGYNFVKSPSSKKPNFKFSSFGIPVGAELQCTLGPHIKCIVIDGSNGILYKGNKTSMSEVVKSLKGGKSQRGTQYFTYKGKLLSDMVDQKS
jgi:hypothetical protein